MYPKASGVASEDINCRCYVEYVTETLYDKDVYEIANIYGYNPLEADKVVNVLREESESWIDKLTEDEKKAINKYTYNGKDSDGKRLFEKINGYLEGRYKPLNEKEEQMLFRNIELISDGLLKNKLEHDIIVFRKDKHPSELEGNINKFLSTSLTKRGVFGKKPNVAIIIPKGINGAYVELLANEGYKHQREFLFNQNIKLKIITNNEMSIYLAKEE